MLNSSDGLDLIAVGLGAELIIVPEFSLTSVSLKDILVSTVTWKLVAHPAAVGAKVRRRSACYYGENIKDVCRHE